MDRVHEEESVSVENSLSMGYDDIGEMAHGEILEAREDVAANVDPTFSIDHLKKELSLGLLPQFWTWCQRGLDVLFTNLDRADFSVRLHLVVHQDLAIEVIKLFHLQTPFFISFVCIHIHGCIFIYNCFVINDYYFHRFRVFPKKSST